MWILKCWLFPFYGCAVSLTDGSMKRTCTVLTAVTNQSVYFNQEMIPHCSNFITFSVCCITSLSHPSSIPTTSGTLLRFVDSWTATRMTSWSAQLEPVSGWRPEMFWAVQRLWSVLYENRMKCCSGTKSIIKPCGFINCQLCWHDLVRFWFML